MKSIGLSAFANVKHWVYLYFLFGKKDGKEDWLMLINTKTIKLNLSLACIISLWSWATLYISLLKGQIFHLLLENFNNFKDSWLVIFRPLMFVIKKYTCSNSCVEHCVFKLTVEAMFGKKGWFYLLIWWQSNDYNLTNLGLINSDNIKGYTDCLQIRST